MDIHLEPRRLPPSKHSNSREFSCSFPLCRCPSGTFEPADTLCEDGMSRLCVNCTDGGCGAGQYARAPCTAHRDLVCSNITACDSEGRASFDTYVIEGALATPECKSHFCCSVAAFVLSPKQGRARGRAGEGRTLFLSSSAMCIDQLLAPCSNPRGGSPLSFSGRPPPQSDSHRAPCLAPVHRTRR